MALHPLTGHEGVRRALGRARAAGTFPTSLLLHGDRGVGKQRLGLWAGQLLLCHEEGEAPCDRCRACRMALRLEHPDLHWHLPLPRPKGSFSSPDRLADALEASRAEALAAVRERSLAPSWSEEARAYYMASARTLRRSARTRPSMAPLQVFLIAEAEALVPQESSPEAANALLKLLEEPPADTFFVLTSNEPGRLLPTLRSRTVPLHVAPLERERVRRFLEEVAGASPDAAARASLLSQGAIGRALGFLPPAGVPGEQGPLDALRRKTWRLLESALDPDAGAAMRRALDYPVAGARALLDDFAALQVWLRDLGGAAAGSHAPLLNEDARGGLEALARKGRVSPAATARAVQRVEEARELARGNVNPQLLMAGLLAGLRRDLGGGAPPPDA